MTLCIFEACSYSRLAEGQERIRDGGGGLGEFVGTTRRGGLGGEKEIKTLGDKKERVGERDKSEWQDG